MDTYKILISGTVQGVGFRPFIYQLATRYGLYGTVLNDTEGVQIIVNVTSGTLQTLLDAIESELPPLASIDNIEVSQIDSQPFDDFEIISTHSDGERTVRIPPDVSVCKACEAELFDPANRRYGYPFISCTHCGVRYSIIYDLPYDRENTSMKFFRMCKRCEKEYKDPMDRRYHAQPIGCWECGPELSLWKDGKMLNIGRKSLLDAASKRLLDGEIVAVKGVGGYHLMCDATNDAAVAKLRERKCRPDKPFAVMVKDIDMANELASVDESEASLLTSKERPIVLLNAKPDNQDLSLSPQIAPAISRIGLFLPYTPLHLLLLAKLDRPVVATSANITDEPICTSRESLEKLSGVYDYVLDHDRQIVNGCDDSVTTVIEGMEMMIRRARGYTPASIKLPLELSENVLALGANQKSTIAVGFDGQAILSPHIGDLDSIGSVEYFKENIKTMQRIYDFRPDVISHDKHPNYESTKYAHTLDEEDITLMPVQHHYAHILGVMAEKGLQGKVLGVAFDGTGYGDDGTLWGGEFLVCDYERFERVVHLENFKLLGGAKAIKEPKRVALSLLFDLYGENVFTMENATTKAFSEDEIKSYFIAWKKGLNAPLSSSVGRLFDAVASLLDVCHVMSFEGQSGMLLEELYDSSVSGHYHFEIKEGKIVILPLIKEVLQEKERAVAVSKFFHTLVEIIDVIHRRYELPLVLSGGVFQNRILTRLVLQRIPEAIISNKIPPNDGGIALGQLAHLLGHNS